MTRDLALAFLWLKLLRFFAQPSEAVGAKIEDLGLNTLAKYATAGFFYSLMEEYYWRWSMPPSSRSAMTWPAIYLYSAVCGYTSDGD
ncbi:MAG: hypothetical protein ABI614_15955 [Planctomycetota bacterium]